MLNAYLVYDLIAEGKHGSSKTCLQGAPLRQHSLIIKHFSKSCPVLQRRGTHHGIVSGGYQISLKHNFHCTIRIEHYFMLNSKIIY